jgi:antitoxin ParD1/3/4
MAMNLQLPNEVSEFVKALVDQGRFESEEAAVVEGIRLLMSQEKLRREIQKGVQQLDNGQWFDEQAVFDEVEAEIDRIEAARQGS